MRRANHEIVINRAFASVVLCVCIYVNNEETWKKGEETWEASGKGGASMGMCVFHYFYIIYYLLN